MTVIRLTPPAEFSFEMNLQFLKRSPREILHRVEGDKVVKLIRIENESILFSIEEEKAKLVLQYLNADPSPEIKVRTEEYVTEWLDLETDLSPFYKLARKDDILK